MRSILKGVSTCFTAFFSTCAMAVVDINLAPPDDLMAFKGIGPSTSQKIVRARPFRDWQDLQDRVAGIGPRTAEKLSSQGLTVNGRAYSPAPLTWKRFEPRPLKPIP
jgi:competence protein ComEA